MHAISSRLTRGIFVTALLLCGACMPRPASLTVPLTLTPTEPTGYAVSLPAQPLKIYIAPAEDSRANKDKIGENREEAAVVPIYAGTPAPAEFIRASVVSEFRQEGLTIVNNDSAADRKVLMTLTNFWAEESPGYKAHITATVQVQDSAGKVLWSGTAFGDGTNYGRSLSVENYQEVLSNAVVRLTSGLIANPGFFHAATGG